MFYVADFGFHLDNTPLHQIPTPPPLAHGCVHTVDRQCRKWWWRRVSLLSLNGWFWRQDATCNVNCNQGSRQITMCFDSILLPVCNCPHLLNWGAKQPVNFLHTGRQGHDFFLHVLSRCDVFWQNCMHIFYISLLLPACLHKDLSDHHIEQKEEFFQCVCISRHQVIDLKYMWLLYVNDISMKRFKKEEEKAGDRGRRKYSQSTRFPFTSTEI